jgi:hypothetical protein
LIGSINVGTSSGARSANVRRRVSEDDLPTRRDHSVSARNIATTKYEIRPTE